MKNKGATVLASRILGSVVKDTNAVIYSVEHLGKKGYRITDSEGAVYEAKSLQKWVRENIEQEDR